MHIVHVLTRLLRAGSEENTIETCRWQAAAGHRVTLIYGAESDAYWVRHMPDGVKAIEVPQMVHPIRPVDDLRAVIALRRVFHELNPDVIHTHQSKAGILGRLAAGAVPKALVVHGIHILPFEGAGLVQRAIYWLAERMVAGRTDVFIPVSDAVGQTYVDAGICDAARMRTVRSGMDLHRFVGAKPPEDWRDLLGLGADQTRPQIVLMMAAFEPRKRHLAFLRAFAEVAEQMPDVVILLAGKGPMEEQVRAAVPKLGLSEKVLFCGHRSDPEALFALAELSILTSEREGLPRVAVQSIAAACPMLAQDLPGLEEIITHRHNGWIADRQDMAGFVGIMRTLLTAAEPLAALARGARETDVSAWSLEALGAQTTQAYLDAMARQAEQEMHPA